jgi:hypothetical protein
MDRLTSGFDRAVSICGFDRDRGPAPSGRRNGSKFAGKTFEHHACIDLNDSVRLFNKTIPEDLQIVQNSRCRNVGRRERRGKDRRVPAISTARRRDPAPFSAS